MTDNVNHPKHYLSHPSGVECITIVEHFNFNLGNAIKYIWRADEKAGLEDLEKAAWYVQREILRRKGGGDAAQKGSMNPKDYGAVGDGVTDDTAAIQRMLDAHQGGAGAESEAEQATGAPGGDHRPEATDRRAEG